MVLMPPDDYSCYRACMVCKRTAVGYLELHYFAEIDGRVEEIQYPWNGCVTHLQKYRRRIEGGVVRMGDLFPDTKNLLR